MLQKNMITLDETILINNVFFSLKNVRMRLRSDPKHYWPLKNNFHSIKIFFLKIVPIIIRSDQYGDITRKKILSVKVFFFSEMLEWDSFVTKKYD